MEHEYREEKKILSIHYSIIIYIYVCVCVCAIEHSDNEFLKNRMHYNIIYIYISYMMYHVGVMYEITI